MKQNYQKTMYACFIGYIVQAVVNNFVPLLFVTFQKTYGIPLEKITMLITFNFAIQLLIDLLSAGFIDRIGYRASVVLAHICAAAGLILLAVMMQPLLRIDLSDVQLNFSKYQETLEQRQAELENTRKEELTSLIEAETAAYISDKAKSMGLTLRVRVTAKMGESGVPVPVRAELTGPWSDTLSGWLETELGLPAERQVWNEN